MYKNHDSEIGKWLGHVFGLPFLDAEEVQDCFVFDFISDKPVCDKLTKFCDYLVDTYIGDDATFPPTVWAEASASLENTSNCCESFHARLNDSFYDIHPTIFVFLKNLQNFKLILISNYKALTVLKLLAAMYARQRNL